MVRPLFLLLLAGCVRLHDPAEETWRDLGVREVDPWLGAPASTAIDDDDLESLERWFDGVDGVRVVAGDDGWGPALELRIRQPVEWFRPDGPSFWQRVYVYRYGETLGEPVVLATRGYDADTTPDQYFWNGLRNALRGNLVVVEHRYFGASIPDVPSFRHLRASQAAADLHRIRTVVGEVFDGPWVSTGASKGGMTALYHRFFFPDDLAGTVADVAPIMTGRADPRFDAYFDKLRGQGCNQPLDAYLDAMVPYLDDVAEHFVALGEVHTTDEARARLESSLLGTEWGTWQYRSYYGEDCGVPEPPDDLDDAIVQMRPGFDSLDQGANSLGHLHTRAAWLYQARHELGYPGPATSRFEDALQHDHEDRYDMDTTAIDDRPFDGNLYAHVTHWLETAEDVVAVYGELDPWTGAAIEASDGVEVFVAPELDHTASFDDLLPDDLARFSDVVASWTGRAIDDGDDIPTLVDDDDGDDLPPAGLPQFLR
jgi:hypothetical protein